jgi:hypothetical protein
MTRPLIDRGSRCVEAKETTMAGIGKYKLTDAISYLFRKAGRKSGGKPTPAHETAAEQVRESQEAFQARNNEASIRDKMVDIGRGNQQAGRQGP